MTKRKISQFISLIFLHSSWGPEVKWLCDPVLSCHSCALSWFACPVGVFIHYSGYHLFPYFAVGTVLLIGVFFGRLLCGWVCPFGFIQDMLHKIPTRKIVLPRWTNNIKYFILLFMVFLIPYFLGEETMYSFCRICPASALQVTLPNIISNGLQPLATITVVKFALLAAILLTVIFSSRAFCRIMCPIGALMAPLNLLSFWRVKPPTDSCISCAKCDKLCPTSVTPSSKIIDVEAPNRSLDCVVCHECRDVCPVENDY